MKHRGCSDSKNALEAWHREVLKLDWDNLNEIKLMYSSASILGDEKYNAPKNQDNFSKDLIS